MCRNQWSRKGGLDHTSILAELPQQLRSEVSLVMHKGVLGSCFLFSDCSEALIHALVHAIFTQSFSPGDVIVREQMPGHEMYFIRRGQVDVVVQGTWMSTLSEGDFFGELALIEPHNVRTATVQAVGFADLFVLTRHDLHAALRSFPHELEKIR